MKSLASSLTASLSRGLAIPQVAARPIQRPRFYNRLVDELLANGIQHCHALSWDLPQRSRTMGADGSRDTSKSVRPTMQVTLPISLGSSEALFTINEFGAFVELGLQARIHAPGLKLPRSL